MSAAWHRLGWVVSEPPGKRRQPIARVFSSGAGMLSVRGGGWLQQRRLLAAVCPHGTGAGSMGAERPVTFFFHLLYRGGRICHVIFPFTCMAHSVLRAVRPSPPSLSECFHDL